MNLHRAILVILFGIVVSACSGIQVQQDYDKSTNFSALKNYAWKMQTQPETGDVRVDSSLANSRIRSAIEHELNAKGYQKTELSEADFWLAYHYEIREKEAAENVRTGVGVGTGSAGTFGGVTFVFGDRAREYEQGELIIDVLDPEAGEILWRGMAAQRPFYEFEPSKATEKINALVAAILDKFPPPAQ